MFQAKNILILVALALGACSSIDKAKLSSNDPSDAANEVRELMQTSRKKQFDLLANEQYDKGENAFNKATNKLADDGERSYVLDTLSESKAYFLEAERVAGTRSTIPSRVFDARKAALENDVFQNSILSKRMNKVDKSLRYETKTFSRELSAEEMSEFQRDYLRLEISAVQNRELGNVRRIIKNSRKNDGPELVSETYHNALNDLKAAENMIQQSSRNPENYSASVEEAKESSKLLGEVMNKLVGVAQGSSEEAVLELVHQERRLTTLSNKNMDLEGSLSRSRDNLSSTNNQLTAKRGQAQESQNKVRIQAAMDDMRNDFSSDEADVYQQGSDLIIRLKKMNFDIGSANVPNHSIRMLSKINSLILKLDASKIKVEGHTDFIGKTEFNHDLSVKRSKAVAEHLRTLGDAKYSVTSEGFGETRPIASNKTKEGRAMNRRVDIVVNTSTEL